MEAEGRRKPKEGDDRAQETLTLDLFDLYWFHRLVLYDHRPPTPPPPPPPSPPPMDIGIAGSPASLLGHGRLNHRRSLSDDLTPTPTAQIGFTKLQTILSGKEAAAEADGVAMSRIIEGQEQRLRERRNHRRKLRRRWRGECSKSMSELEFEELKGFMDLGFTFSDAEDDPRLMEIVPGLQRLKSSSSAATSADDAAAAAVPRPYLSEAWDVASLEVEEENRLGEFRVLVDSAEDGMDSSSEEEEKDQLRDFRIEDGIDVKDQLRFWAHTVASAVR